MDRYPTATTSTTTYSYAATATNPGGAWLASRTTQNGATTSYGYDNIGENTSITQAGATTTNQYDFLGRTAKTSVPAVTGTGITATTESYDLAGDVIGTTRIDATGATISATTASYDANGNLLAATDGRGHTSHFTYDAANQLTSEVQPVSATESITTSFGYDAAGNRSRYTDGRGNATITTYNSWGLPESTIEPATATYTTAADGTFTTSYDADGRPVAQTAPGGVSVTAGYDLVGNLTSQTGNGADAATAERTFGYDTDGRLTSAATAAAAGQTATSETFTYNDRGELLTAGGSAGASSFGYDPDGLMSTRADAAGTTSYTYDGADRLKTVADPATGTTLTYGYNTVSQPDTISYGTGGNLRSYGYDDAHRLTSDTLKSAGGSTVASIGYGYDGNDNVTSKTTTGFAGAAANSYGYDWADRLSSWTQGSTEVDYGYDAAGNRTRVGADVYTYDARDQLTSDGTNSYSYTARGTLTTQTSVGGTVTSSSDAYGEAMTQGSQTYGYDAAGRVMQAASSGGGTRTFTYSGAGNTAAGDGSNTYTRDPGDGLVAIGTAGGDTSTARLAYTDAHTDVVADFTSTGTTLDGSASYDPLGNTTARANLLGNLGFQSGWTDPATAKVNMASRWYNPATGQFMNKDTATPSPVPNSANANPFAYVDDNPVTGTDPTGHCWFACGILHKVSSAVSSAWDSTSNWASDAWNTTTSWASDAWDWGISTAAHAYNASTHCVKDLVACGKKVIKKVKRAYHKATRYLKKEYHKAVHAVRTAAHKAAEAVKHPLKTLKATATFVKNHAGAIASMVVSAVVFIGCDAALGAVTGGVGAVAGAAICGGLAGAVGGLVTQGAKCISGTKADCSVGSFLKAGLVGGVTGAVAGFGGALGGKIISSVGGKALDAIGGVFEGGAADATESAATDVASEVTDTTAAEAEEGTASAADQSDSARAESEDSAGCSTSTPHSFTGTTRVVMADGSSKPISQVKIGDKIKNAAPGAKDTETHTVDNVIVTTTDHDFVDVTVKPVGRQSGSRLMKHARTAAAIALAAVLGTPTTANAATTEAATTSNGGGTITTTYHHPFYDQTQAAFVDAQNLHIGDILQTTDGEAQITALRLYHATQTTYDLTINGLHTYYVEAGATPILVHNCDVSLSREEADSLRPPASGFKSIVAKFRETVRGTERSQLRGESCHTCGRVSEDFVGDHQPISAFSPWGAIQRLFNQCRICSNYQGTATLKGLAILRNHFGILDPQSVPDAYEKLMSVLDDHV